MKTYILVLAIAATTLAACNSNSKKSTEVQNRNIDTTTKAQADQPTGTKSSGRDLKATVPVKEIINIYLQLKNAFVNDNSSDAANTGTALEAAFKNFDKTALSADQKKIFEDVEDDAREHAEHIGKNGGNIKHQREHFELLSKDMFDLVKTLGGGQVLYKVSDPMYNKGKGAFWLSETKEIKNPYMGKAMSNSGSIIEEIK